MTGPGNTPLIEVRNLVKHFPITGAIPFQSQSGAVKAVDGVSLHAMAGETLGIAGESGAGKSTIARLIVRLLVATEGEVLFEGEDIAAREGARLKSLSRQMQMIFPDPYSSLNPSRTAGSIIAEPFAIHVHNAGGERKRRVQELLERVGLSAEDYNRYPHELSGAERQRVGIARAIALAPKLLVADEPASALDVSTQAQLLHLLRDLRRVLGLTLIFISRDLSVVAHMCDRVAVMYLGKIVELAPTDALYRFPRHPYTGALLSAVPIPGLPRDLHPAGERRERQLHSDEMPSPASPPSGCRFHPRCPKAQPRCSLQEPALSDQGTGSLAACHFPLTQEEAERMLPSAPTGAG